LNIIESNNWPLINSDLVDYSIRGALLQFVYSMLTEYS